MSLSYYNPQRRYRQRVMQRVYALASVLVMGGVFFGVGMWFGGVRASQNEKYLRERVKTLEQEHVSLEQQLTQLSAESQTVSIRYKQLQDQYREQVSGGPMQELVALLQKQLEQGRDPQRLAFAIESSRPPQNCTEPETKRFVVSTPAYEGAESVISIAEGAVIISGKGESAKNSKGESEAWYDPSREIEVVFTLKDGSVNRKKGNMPIQHSVVLEGREYRFTIEPGARSFAKATFDSCDYP